MAFGTAPAIGSRVENEGNEKKLYMIEIKLWNRLKMSEAKDLDARLFDKHSNYPEVCQKKKQNHQDREQLTFIHFFLSFLPMLSYTRSLDGMFEKV